MLFYKPNLQLCVRFVWPCSNSWRGKGCQPQQSCYAAFSKMFSFPTDGIRIVNIVLDHTCQMLSITEDGTVLQWLIQFFSWQARFHYLLTISCRWVSSAVLIILHEHNFTLSLDSSSLCLHSNCNKFPPLIFNLSAICNLSSLSCHVSRMTHIPSSHYQKEFVPDSLIMNYYFICQESFVNIYFMCFPNHCPAHSALPMTN